MQDDQLRDARTVSSNTADLIFKQKQPGPPGNKWSAFVDDEFMNLKRGYDDAFTSQLLIEQLLSKFRVNGAASDYEAAFRALMEAKRRSEEARTALEFYWLTH